MKIINVTNASEDICNLIEQVNNNNEAIFIIGKNRNAVLISDEAYKTVQELIRAMLEYVLDKIKEKRN